MPLMGKTSRTKILNYIKGKKKVYPSDIAYDLDMEYEEVGKILTQLKQEGIISDKEMDEE